MLRSSNEWLDFKGFEPAFTTTGMCDFLDGGIFLTAIDNFFPNLWFHIKRTNLPLTNDRMSVIGNNGVMANVGDAISSRGQSRHISK